MCVGVVAKHFREKWKKQLLQHFTKQKRRRFHTKKYRNVLKSKKKKCQIEEEIVCLGAFINVV